MWNSLTNISPGDLDFKWGEDKEGIYNLFNYFTHYSKTNVKTLLASKPVRHVRVANKIAVPSWSIALKRTRYILHILCRIILSVRRDSGRTLDRPRVISMKCPVSTIVHRPVCQHIQLIRTIVLPEGSAGGDYALSPPGGSTTAPRVPLQGRIR